MREERAALLLNTGSPEPETRLGLSRGNDSWAGRVNRYAAPVADSTPEREAGPSPQSQVLG